MWILTDKHVIYPKNKEFYQNETEQTHPNDSSHSPPLAPLGFNKENYDGYNREDQRGKSEIFILLALLIVHSKGKHIGKILDEDGYTDSHEKHKRSPPDNPIHNSFISQRAFFILYAPNPISHFWSPTRLGSLLEFVYIPR